MSYTRTPTATLTELYCTATAQFEVDPRNPGPGWALRMLGCLWSFQQSRSWGPTVTPLCGLNTGPKWFGSPPCSHPVGGRRECLGSGHLRDRVVSDPGGPNCSPRPLGFSRRPPRYVSGGGPRGGTTVGLARERCSPGRSVARRPGLSSCTSPSHFPEGGTSAH